MCIFHPDGGACCKTHVCCLFVVVYVVHVSGETKVGDFHDVVFCDEDVSGCQVSMDTLRDTNTKTLTQMTENTFIHVFKQRHKSCRFHEVNDIFLVQSIQAQLP